MARIPAEAFTSPPDQFSGAIGASRTQRELIERMKQRGFTQPSILTYLEMKTLVGPIDMLPIVTNAREFFDIDDGADVGIDNMVTIIHENGEMTYVIKHKEQNKGGPRFTWIPSTHNSLEDANVIAANLKQYAQAHGQDRQVVSGPTEEEPYVAVSTLDGSALLSVNHREIIGIIFRPQVEDRSETNRPINHGTIDFIYRNR